MLQSFATNCLSQSLPTSSSTLTTTSTRPNIIFIISDDHRWDALGVVQREQAERARFPWFKTPHLDRIASEGARFRNAFVVQSLCSPSRAAFLTGQYSHRHGVKDNSTELRSDLPNWAAALREAGYSTGYFGKWHMNSQRERPGFSTVYSYVGQGIYDNCPVMADGEDTSTTGWIDDVVTSKAIEFIEQHPASPFAIVLGFKTPHDPRTPPTRRANDYAHIEIGPPASYRDLPPFLTAIGVHPVDYIKRQQDWLNYFRCLAAMDDAIGSLLHTLDKTGLTENTILIYAGDNGFYLGEHGMDDKRNAHEESIRIPFLARYPKLIKSGTLINEVTLNIDMASTLLELAGLKSQPGMQGRSWLPLVRGESVADWRTTFFYESFKDSAYPKVTVDLEAVRTPTAKLILYPGHDDWTELYDLAKDPSERKNLVSDSSATQLMSSMQKVLDQHRRPSGL
ncbi:MAG: sulfatase family protein [Candidatus Sumerlaeaceae bacterium]